MKVDNKMNIIFYNLKKSVSDSFENTDLDKVNYALQKIDSPTLVTGVGGSNVVSCFASKVLNKKNNIIATNVEMRDILYMNLAGYDNILSCSYSGNNYGVLMSFSNDLKHYLLTTNKRSFDGVNTINYNMPCEESFVSLAATLVPCSILLNYYYDGCRDILKEIDEYNYSFDRGCDCFEIFSGYDTSVLSNYLDSTMIESGIGIPIIHDKYAFCHGRSTISKYSDSIAIYFNKDTEFDKLMLKLLPDYYKSVIKIDVGDGLIGEYNALVQVMYLTKYLACSDNKSLSDVNYSPLVYKLYNFKGKI